MRPANRLADEFRRYFRNMNPIILTCTAGLVLAGIVLIYSATFNMDRTLFSKQLIWYGAGFAAMILFANINYNSLLNLANYFYIFVLFLLLLVFFIGHESHGAQLWIKMKGFNIQPSEFMKIFLPLAVIRYILMNPKRAYTAKGLGVIAVMTAVPGIMILKQPDLGTMLLLIPIILAALFIGNMPGKKLTAIVLAGILAMPIGYFMLKDYQKQRLEVFVNPQADRLGAGYNVIQSKIAVGSGQFAGKGWLQGTQSQLNFIPIKYTDFIFAVAAEEFGFLGSLLLVALYYILIMEGLKVVKMCRYEGGKMLAAAMTTMLFSQFFINIGMNIGLMPVTGITLPLVSYGGSSVLVTMMALGIMHNINKEYMKAEE